MPALRHAEYGHTTGTVVKTTGGTPVPPATLIFNLHRRKWTWWHGLLVLGCSYGGRYVAFRFSSEQIAHLARVQGSFRPG